VLNKIQADCENCFGLCCVALPYVKSADFALDKEGGTPCSNLQSDFRCKIHKNLRTEGYKGCTVYECFGAGQKVSQITYGGKNWREHPEIAEEMFKVFPVMQQIHEMLRYLYEAIKLEETCCIHDELQRLIDQLESLTNLEPQEILKLDITVYRGDVSDLLSRTSELVRDKVNNKPPKQINRYKIGRGCNLMGANLRQTDLKGANLRGALLIGANLKESDIRFANLLGADLRDADLSGANLAGSLFLTQAQINSAKGNRETVLPSLLSMPEHWKGK